MPLFPQVEQQYTQQIVTDTFGGYNHQLKIPDGEWYDTKNLTTDYAPMLANRKLRGNLNTSATSVAEKKSLAYVSANGTLYFNFVATGLTGLSTTPTAEKTLVSMGAYLLVFPDKKYINTENLSEYGDIEAKFSPASASYQMVRYDGSAVTATTGSTAPDAQDDWVSVETVYIKITFNTMGQVPNLFKEYDGVTISGSSIEDVNGDKVIYALGGRAIDPEIPDDTGEDDWIMVTGLLDFIPDDPDTSVKVNREMPDLDYICECQNRLWGCYYGHKDGKTINEIYCSALGDFKNWNQFVGISADSWVGSVGSDGQWTGAVNYLGYPTFFKENRIHRVTVSTEGAHRIDETVCRGVQKGSSKSLVVVNETLYYKSRSDVCAYQGGFPNGVSSALGTEQYTDAAAGAVGSKYYISMKDSANTWHLFVYDIAKGIWLHEDNLHVTQFARVDNELFAVSGNNLYTLLGSLPIAAGTAETGMTWEAVSGVQYYSYPMDKIRNAYGFPEIQNARVSRYNIRMKMAQGSSLAVYLQYDSNGTWVSAGSVTAATANIDSCLFPIRPHRCDHLQIKLVGSGDIRIYSIAKILEVGSDYR